jgi:N-methylhydantoinase A
MSNRGPDRGATDGATALLIAIDTGGTFTDVVWLAGDGLGALKLPSTPDDPARAVLDGVRAALAAADAGPADLVHGSTVATNALLEGRIARAALVTNAGFEDVLEIGRQTRPQLYALVSTRPPPLVPAERRIGIAGRTGPDGEELEPLDSAQLAGLPARLSGFESIAVCLLHAYADPSHEARVAAALAPLGVPVTCSSVILPEHREYERTATTVVNACITPRMDAYLARVEAESGARRVRIMGSAGGVMSVARARAAAVHTVLSGPAGGVAGALEAARRAGHERIITFDMGGTSTDVSLCPGRALHTREFRIAGVPVAVPVLDIHTVGAGGGSIARVDAGGALRVGPASAGALPGPVCYGRGGSEITVTDAHVALGRIPPSAWAHRLDGTGLRADLVTAPLARLADAMGVAPLEAAEGVLAVADAAMEGALRLISVERGYDPADFNLVCFGGAAGLHAAELAARLGVPRVLVPPLPGVLSAFGMLVAPVRKDVAKAVLRAGRSTAEVPVEAVFAELERDAVAALVEDGLDPRTIALRRRVDARYAGQGWELTVDADDWVEAFHDLHERRFGYRVPGAIVEAVTLRVEAVAAAPGRHAAAAPARAVRPAAPARTTVRHAGAPVEADLWQRDRLRAGARIPGPAIVAEYTATLWVPPGWSATVLPDATLCVEAT